MNLPITVPFYADKFNLLVYADELGDLCPIRSVNEWQIRRQHILANMQLVMSELHDESKRVFLDAQILGEQDCGKFVRRKISFKPEPNDRLMA